MFLFSDKTPLAHFIHSKKSSSLICKFFLKLNFNCTKNIEVWKNVGFKKFQGWKLLEIKGLGFFLIWWSHHHPVQMFVVSRHFECISCICITIEFGCYLKVHMDQFCIEYPTQFETQIGPGVKMSLNWRWFFGTLPLHVELAKILVVHSQKKGMRLSRKLPKSKPKKWSYSDLRRK